jgi:transcriptional regulator with XRE-family HTH domain
LRKIKGWTQEVLAEKADIDYKYLGAIDKNSFTSFLNLS